MTLRLEPTLKFREQTGFASAGFAHEGDHLSLAFQHSLERDKQIAELPIAPDEWHIRPMCLQAAGRARRGNCCKSRIDSNRLGFALERNIAQGFEVERMPSKRIGRLADEDLT